MKKYFILSNTCLYPIKLTILNKDRWLKSKVQRLNKYKGKLLTCIVLLLRLVTRKHSIIVYRLFPEKMLFFIKRVLDDGTYSKKLHRLKWHFKLVRCKPFAEKIPFWSHTCIYLIKFCYFYDHRIKIIHFLKGFWMQVAGWKVSYRGRIDLRDFEWWHSKKINIGLIITS